MNKPRFLLLSHRVIPQYVYSIDFLLGQRFQEVLFKRKTVFLLNLISPSILPSRSGLTFPIVISLRLSFLWIPESSDREASGRGYISPTTHYIFLHLHLCLNHLGLAAPLLSHRVSHKSKSCSSFIPRVPHSSPWRITKLNKGAGDDKAFQLFPSLCLV